MQPIILASQSPRRKQLLEWAEISFEVLVKETDEAFPDHLTLEEIPVYIARNKAKAVIASGLLPDSETARIILAADTIVTLDGDVIGKPKDRENAIEILTRLSGRVHQVITGVVIINGGDEISFADTTEVAFHPLSHQQITFYIDKYKPYDKAGAYAIQEWIGVTGIRHIRGDFYNVMGLPVSRVVKALHDLR